MVIIGFILGLVIGLFIGFLLGATGAQLAAKNKCRQRGSPIPIFTKEGKLVDPKRQEQGESFDA